MGRFAPWRRPVSLTGQVTGIADGTDLETRERYRGCGQVTRKVRIEDTQGRVHEIAVTVFGWKVLLLIDALHQDSPGGHGGEDPGA
jgi:hypothetical protein